MPKFIIAHGWHSTLDVIEAPSLDAARTEATQRSMRAGLLDDDLSDTTWAEPYTDDMAWDLGLLDPPTQRDAWRSQAPWR